MCHDMGNMNETKLKLNEVIRRELHKRSQSLNQVAKDCGIPVSVLHGWHQGVAPSGRNLHLLDQLATYWALPMGVLLFDKKEGPADSEVLFSSTFKDGVIQYKLVIEKMRS